MRVAFSGHFAAVFLAVALLALVLAACGGSNQPDSSPTAETKASGATTQAPASEVPRQGRRGFAGSGQPHYQGGEESVEGFGSEAAGSSKEEILASEQGYLRALSHESFKQTCTYLAGAVTQSLKQLAGPQSEAGGCAAILPKLLSPAAATTAHQQLDGTITGVRVKGDQAFVLFNAPGAKVYVFTLAREGRTWKVAMLSASVLVP